MSFVKGYLDAVNKNLYLKWCLDFYRHYISSFIEKYLSPFRKSTRVDNRSTFNDYIGLI